MPAIKSTAAFDRWLKRLKDQRGRAKILARLDRLLDGNPGDVRWIGEGGTEMRIDFRSWLPRLLHADRRRLRDAARRRQGLAEEGHRQGAAARWRTGTMTTNEHGQAPTVRYRPSSR